MNDILFLMGGMITVGLAYIVYIVIETCKTCNHRWSRWTDPVEKEGWLWQFRVCEKCNQQDTRKVQ